MTLYKIDKSYDANSTKSKRAGSVMRMFGIDATSYKERMPVHLAEIEIKEGDVCFITGPTGGGKSTVLEELNNQFGPDVQIEHKEPLAYADCVIDCFSGDIGDAMQLLSAVGITGAFTLLEMPTNLSHSQKGLFHLALALDSDKKVLIIDNFCDGLDRLTASVSALKLTRYARRNEITLIVATSADDIMADMSPDVIVIKRLRNKAEIIYKQAH